MATTKEIQICSLCAAQLTENNTVLLEINCPDTPGKLQLALHSLCSFLRKEVPAPHRKNTLQIEGYSNELPVEISQLIDQGANSSKPSNNNSSNEGTIVNNYYANNYYGSIDASGQSMGSKPESSLGSLVDSFGSIAGAMLLDQDTEETTNLSDRIITEKVSNTAINTQSTVGRMVGYGVRQSVTPIMSASDDPSEPTRATERFFSFRLTDWTTSQTPFQFQTFTPVHRLTELKSVIKTNFDAHTFYKTGWRVQVQCNASQFHSGSLLVFFAPEFLKAKLTAAENGKYTATDHGKDLTTWTSPYPVVWDNQSENDWQSTKGTLGMFNSTPEQWTVYPHQILNLRTGTTVSLEVPWVNVAPGSYHEVHSVWTLVVAVLTPLQFSSGSSPSVDINVSVAPVSPVFHGLHQIADQGIPTQPRENSQMFLTTLPDRSAPAYGKVEPPRMSMPGKVKSFLDVMKLPTFVTVQNKNPAGTPYFSVTNDLKAEPLFEMNVILSDNHLYHTALACGATNFVNYRGSIVMTTVFTGAAMCKGKFLLCYTPPGAGKPANVEEAMQSTYAIWDIGLNSTFRFTIPFISASEWRLTYAGTASILSADGWFTIFQYTPLTYPVGTPPQADVLLLASAGEDFSVRIPMTPFLSQSTDNAETGDPQIPNVDTDFTSKPQEILSETCAKFKFFYDRATYLTTIANSNPRSATQLAMKQNRIALLTPHFSLTLTTSLSRFRYRNTDTTNNNVNCACCYPFLASACFTYWRSDLEVVVMPRGTDVGRYQVVWTPCGGAIETSTSPATLELNKGLLGNKPVATNYGDRPVSFVVPWTTPLSFMPFTYDGWPDYKKDGTNYGLAPYANYGTIQIFCEASAEKWFDIYIRFKNFQANCPRPFLTKYSQWTNSREKILTSNSDRFALEIPDATPADVETDSTWIRDLTSEGVEPNPGPFSGSLMEAAIKDFVANCPDLTDKELEHLDSVAKKLTASPVVKAATHSAKVSQDMAAFQRFLESEDPVQTLVNGWDTIREIQQLYRSAKNLFSETSFWYDFLLRMAKMTVCSVVWALNPTPSVTLGLMLLSLLDAFSITAIKDKIISYFTPILGPPPEPPQLEEPGFLSKLKSFFKHECAVEMLTDEAPLDGVRDTNVVFMLLKNIEWCVNLFKKLFDWVKAWFEQPAAKDSVVLEEMLTQFGTHASEVSAFRAGFSTEPPQKSFDFFKELHDLAAKLQKTAVVNMAAKYMDTRSNDKPRMEPIVVVLRGKPGAGKSISAQLLAQAISKMNVDKQSVYSFPPDCDHLDGYTGQYSVIMDDLGQNPDGKDFSTFCQMVSTTNFIPSMAHLQDKGRPFTSQFIVATTNLGRFNPVTIADINAVNRRITLDLTVTPGVECMVDGKLDLASAIQPTGPAIGPFKQECELLHKAGLVFTDNRTGNHYSLLEVVDVVNATIRNKQQVLDSFLGLVFESGAEDEDDLLKPFAHMNISQADKDRLADELRSLRAQVADLKLAQIEFSKLVIILSGIIGAAVVLLKVAKYIKQFSSKYIAPQPTNICNVNLPETLPVLQKPVPQERPVHFPDFPDMQAAYSGMPSQRKTPKLELQGPTQTVGDFEKYVSTHVVACFSVKNDDWVVSQSCVLVNSRCIMVNTHTWDKVQDKFEVRGVTYSASQCKSVSLEVGGVGTDMTIVKLPVGQMFKNNISKFPKKGCVFPQRTTPVVGVSYGPLFYTGKVLRPPSQLVIERGPTANMFLYQAATAPGYCGSCVVGPADGHRVILGVHSAGACGLAGAVYITQEDLLAATRFLSEPTSLSSEGLIEYTSPGPAVHVPRKTKLKKTFAYPLFKPDAGPAVLSSRDPRLDPDVNFDKELFAKHTSDMDSLPPEFKDAAIWYANHLFNYIGRDNEPIGLKEAIKGFQYLDKMDPKTSPGLPYTLHGTKRTDLVDFDMGVVLSADLNQRIARMMAGDYSDHVFQTFLKDEIRKMEKIRRGKTRIVDVPNLAHVLVGRILLGRFCSKIHANPGTQIGSAIGCDPDLHWTQFAQEMMDYTYVYDVDYSNFDATHPTALFDILCDHVFTTENGFSPEVRAFLQSLSVSHHAFLDQRMTIKGGLPSGCSSTSVLNTVMNNIIVRAGLKLTYQNFEFDDVKILAYGDDLLVASNYQIDFNKVKAKLDELTNYRITPASKGGSFPLVSSLMDVTFLKRSFEPFDVLNFVFRPKMATSNLELMLSFYTPGTLQAKVHSIALLAFHSGKEVYDRLFQPFRDAGLDVPSWWILESSWQHQFR